MKLSGRCYCGDVAFAAEGEPVMRAQCHCRECQYITGGGPNVFVAMPLEGFTYTRGEPARFERDDLQRPVRREFCRRCGTHLTSWPPGFPAVIVKVGALDDPKAFGGPQLAIFTCDAQPFHLIAEGVPAYERTPGA